MLPASGRVVDLGSGGGLPGLPLIAARPDLTWILVDANLRRTTWLRTAVEGAAEVRTERAELTGRGHLRGAVDVVLARSFAAPAVTAECAAPLLRVGGVMWVAEPPSPSPSRWPAEGLATLGLERQPRTVESWQSFVQVTECPSTYPRRVGIPTKRPLF